MGRANREVWVLLVRNALQKALNYITLKKLALTASDTRIQRIYSQIKEILTCLQLLLYALG